MDLRLMPHLLDCASPWHQHKRDSRCYSLVDSRSLLQASPSPLSWTPTQVSRTLQRSSLFLLATAILWSLFPWAATPYIY